MSKPNDLGQRFAGIWTHSSWKNRRNWLWFLFCPQFSYMYEIRALGGCSRVWILSLFSSRCNNNYCPTFWFYQTPEKNPHRKIRYFSWIHLQIAIWPFILSVQSIDFFLAEWPFTPCWYMNCFDVDSIIFSPVSGSFFTRSVDEGLIHTKTLSSLGHRSQLLWTIWTFSCCLHLYKIVLTDECCTFRHLETVTNEIHNSFTDFLADFFLISHKDKVFEVLP